MIALTLALSLPLTRCWLPLRALLEVYVEQANTVIVVVAKLLLLLLLIALLGGIRP